MVKKGIIFGFLLSAGLLTACGKENNIKAEKTDDIKVIYTNDVHCAFDKNEDCVGLDGVAGYAELMKREYHNLMLVDNGDFVQGDFVGTISNGEYPIYLRNEMGYEIGSVGNHEFDYSMEQFIGKDGLAEKSKMKYLSCNFKDLRTDELVFEPYKIKQYGDIKVGYLGIITPETLTTSKPSSFKNQDGNYIYGFSEGENGDVLARTVQKYIDELKNNNCDYIIALTHLGIYEGAYSVNSLISKTTGIDVYLDGHSHTVIEKELVLDKDNKEVIVSSTGSKLFSFGDLTINTFNTKSKSDDEIIPKLVKKSDLTDEVYKTESADIVRRLSNYIAESTEALSQRIIGNSEQTLSITNELGVRLVRNSETKIGNFVADCYRASSDSIIAFVNGGGVRNTLYAGEIKYRDVQELNPFNNELSVINAEGSKILDALELSAKDLQRDVYKATTSDTGISYNAVGEFGGFMSVSGIKFDIDLNVESTVKLDEHNNFVEVLGNRRIKNCYVYNNETSSYEEINPNKKYSLTIAGSIQKSGIDGFTMFMDCEVLLENYIIDSQAIINCIQNDFNGTITNSYLDTLLGRINILGR